MDRGSEELGAQGWDTEIFGCMERQGDSRSSESGSCPDSWDPVVPGSVSPVSASRTVKTGGRCRSLHVDDSTFCFFKPRGMNWWPDGDVGIRDLGPVGNNQKSVTAAVRRR